MTAGDRRLLKGGVAGGDVLSTVEFSEVEFGAVGFSPAGIRPRPGP